MTSPIIVWKGTATNVAIPSNSRPFTNTDTNLRTLPRTAFKANPLKHWRKQLHPYYETTSSNQVSLDDVYGPSVAVQGCDCDSTNNAKILKENITLLSECDGTRYVDASNNDMTICTGGTNHIRRQANTVIKKGYYVNHAQYLQAKCKSYEQNIRLGSNTATYTYSSAGCVGSENGGCDKPLIFKPSNTSHNTQGAVSASANLLRKKNNVITLNNSTLKSAYGNTFTTNRSYNNGTTSYPNQYIKGDTTSSRNCEQTLKSCASA